MLSRWRESWSHAYSQIAKGKLPLGGDWHFQEIPEGLILRYSHVNAFNQKVHGIWLVMGKSVHPSNGTGMHITKHLRPLRDVNIDLARDVTDLALGNKTRSEIERRKGKVARDNSEMAQVAEKYLEKLLTRFDRKTLYRIYREAYRAEGEAEKNSAFGDDTLLHRERDRIRQKHGLSKKEYDSLMGAGLLLKWFTDSAYGLEPPE